MWARKFHNKPWKQAPFTTQKKSDTMKDWLKNHVHPRKGKDPWNKGKKDLQVGWNKGLKMKTTVCPHCGKLVDIGNGKRWHFDNCKNKKST